MSAGEQAAGERVFGIIPAYNESTPLAEVVAGLAQVVDRVVVIDDGSSDDTGRVARNAGAEVLIHRINLGQGAALQTGILYALREGASLIVTFDADGQHMPDDVPRMIAALRADKADLAMGSRFLGSTEGMPWQRRLLLRAAVVFTRITTGLRVSDAHNGLRVLTRDAAAAIRIRHNRMAHASEILGEVARHKLRYIELPVHIRYTAYSIAKGQKMMGAVDILLDLLNARFLR